MSRNLFTYLFFAVLLILHSGCSTHWSEAIQRGKVDESKFDESVNIEVSNGLIIVPVKINGETLRFLFDSGAPFSISEKLQSRSNFKVISQGHIVDTNKNRSKVNYVSVDTIFIQNISFSDQTAFVGDFEANPLIKCLQLDGIIGSNLIRHCNWKINYQDETITMSKNQTPEINSQCISIPFHTDAQYNILVNLSMGNTEIKNLTIDYGSNGSLTLPTKTFNLLKQKNTTLNTFEQKGITQSGIIGKPTRIHREITYLDITKSNEWAIENVEIKSGGSSLVGGEILSRYVVSIDWENKHIYLNERDSVLVSHETFGFFLGKHKGENLHIQSVIEGSPAYYKGLQTNMQVLKIDSLDFTKTHGLCDYMHLMNEKPDELSLELITLEGEIKKVLLEKKNLSKEK